MELTKRQLRRLLRLAYDAGWNSSGEGWNAEYPGRPEDLSPEQRARCYKARARAVEAIEQKTEHGDVSARETDSL